MRATDQPSVMVPIGLGLLIAATIFYQQADLIFSQPDRMVGLGALKDDAYFYATIARNYWRYGFFTLDGVMPTNGFQPLWMGLHVGLAYLFPLTEGTSLLVYASVAAYVLFAILTVFLLWQAGSSVRALSMVGIVGLVILNTSFQEFVINGLEVPLCLSLIVLTMLVINCGARGGGDYVVTAQHGGALALCASLTFLARTDFFWLWTAVFLWILFHRSGWRTLVAYLGVSFVLVAPYLVSNLIFCDALMPLSGRVKRHYLNTFYPSISSYLSSDEWQGMFAGFQSVFRLDPILSMNATVASVLVLMALLLVVLWQIRKRASIPPALSILTLAVALHVLFMHLWYRELRPYTSYYFTPEIFWFVLTALFVLEKVFVLSWSKGRSWRGVGGIIVTLIIIAISYRTFVPANKNLSAYWMTRLEIAKEIDAIVPSGQRIGAYWPGLIAEHSNRPIAPIDGVIGSSDYFEKYVKSERELSYLRENRISYLLVYLSRPPDRLRLDAYEPVASWAMLIESRLWEARNLDWEVVTSKVYGDKGEGWYLLRFPEFEKEDSDALLTENTPRVDF